MGHGNIASLWKAKTILEFETSLGYMSRPCFISNKTNPRITANGCKQPPCLTAEWMEAVSNLDALDSVKEEDRSERCGELLLWSPLFFASMWFVELVSLWAWCLTCRPGWSLTCGNSHSLSQVLGVQMCFHMSNLFCLCLFVSRRFLIA